MEAEATDETSAFFFRDTVRRLSRLAEQSLAYSIFALLLYCRLAYPGGNAVWSWSESTCGFPILWALVFMPLFLLDWRNWVHLRYLRENRFRFLNHDSQSSEKLLNRCSKYESEHHYRYAWSPIYN
eukprot:g2877.t1